MNIEEVLAKATKSNISEGYCYQCRKPIGNSRKGRKFCSKSCKQEFYSYRNVKPKYMCHKYMEIYLGRMPERRRGNNPRIFGAMSEYTHQFSGPVLLIPENISKSLCADMYGISLCNGAILTKEEALLLADYLENETNI